LMAEKFIDFHILCENLVYNKKRVNN